MKKEKHHSRIDIAFLIICAVLMYLPMSHISNAEISTKENRKFATWQPLITKNGKLNYNFGKDFDNWFNDRFFLRLQIVKMYSAMRYNMAYQYYETQKGFLNKKNNWMNNLISLNKYEVSREEQDEIIKNIQKLQEFCNKNEIKLYVIIPPIKEEICYKELYPILGHNDKYEKNIELINKIYDKTGLQIIYPFKELEEYHQTNYAYFKSDPHWTDDAAYLGYLQIMKEVKKDFPNIYINTENDFDYEYSNLVRVLPKNGFFEGRNYEVLKLHDKKVLDAKYKYYKHKDYKSLAYKSVFKDKIFHLHYQYNQYAPNLVLFGDSFSLNLLPAIVYSFNNTDNIYTYTLEGVSKYDRFNINRFEDEILQNNTNVLVICLSELKRLRYLYGKDE